MKYHYIAGPMTGIRQFNYPAFAAAAEKLRALGCRVISPHEHDSEAVQEAAWHSPDGQLVEGKTGGMTWGEILAKDVQLIADDVDSIVFLPGWERSRGAKLEATLGLLCGHKFYDIAAPKTELGAAWVKEKLLARL